MQCSANTICTKRKSITVKSKPEGSPTQEALRDLRSAEITSSRVVFAATALLYVSYLLQQSC
jgi:hypothetical protein